MSPDKPRHQCVESSPYHPTRHALHDVEHPYATYLRDSVAIRGGHRMWVMKCDVCGNRFETQPRDLYPVVEEVVEIPPEEE